MIPDRLTRNMKTPTVRIAVPPGIGDTYWALCKLKDFRKQLGIKHVTLCVKRHELARALDWPKMVDFVEATEQFDFETNKGIRETGFSNKKPGVHYVFWPNAIIDRGQHLSEWMPRYELDMDFKIHTLDGLPEREIVIYASSWEVNSVWLPEQRPSFWNELIREVKRQTGRTPMLIGAGWDGIYRQEITEPVYDMVGKTSLQEVATILERADLVIGVISGMTILANHFQTPTIAFYPEKFEPGFLKAWIKPGTPYAPICTAGEMDPGNIVALGKEIMRK